MSVKVIRGDRILRLVFSGGTPGEEIYAEIHRAFTDVPPDMDLIWDVRASTSLASRTTEFVRMIAEFVVDHPGRPGRRLAVLLPPGEKDRWEKLIEQLGRDDGPDIGLFEDETAVLDAFLS